MCNLNMENCKTVMKDVKGVLSKWRKSLCVKAGHLNNDELLALFTLT